MPFRTKPKPRSVRDSDITVRLGRFGSKTKILKLAPGTTVKDLVIAHELGSFAVRVNTRRPRLARKLRDGDIVVATPQRISGGAAGRHDDLDLDECRRRMSPSDLRFFVNFVGAEAYRFDGSDLDPL
jgi:hypothetical protein